MSKITEQYSEFVRKMWVENCIERDSFNEKNLSHAEYEQKYTSFLEDTFYSTIGATMVWSEDKADYVTA
tara:strand:- start:215 stop:421 length:207 start_codon:yes stop_codon:yes gene_type:complete